jgi:hypothetical protein
MNDGSAPKNAFECVEPDVGRELRHWTGPGATAAQRAQREDHLRICDACRLEAAVAREMLAGLADGSLVLPGNSAAAHRRRPRVLPIRPFPALTGAAACLVAAGLALAVLLPPVSPAGPGADRSGAEEGFVRPVEGETVGSDDLQFRWHPVTDATGYALRVEEVGGDFAWEGDSPTGSLVLPASVDLPVAREFRAYLTPIPRDLAPSGSLSVRFRSGTAGAVWRYRATAAPWPARWLVLAGLLAGMAAVGLRIGGRFRMPVPAD